MTVEKRAADNYFRLTGIAQCWKAVHNSFTELGFIRLAMKRQGARNTGPVPRETGL